MWSNISAPRSGKQSALKDGSSSSEIYNQDKNHIDQIVEQENKEHNELGNPQGSPVMRYKHAVCSSLSTGYIYIHGGRYGNLPLDDDIWRFDPHQNTWIQLQTTGKKPPSLQEHTLIEYNDQLYLFGGQVSASNNEDSFWRLDLVNNEWHSLNLRSSKFGAHLGPTNRRGHSAITYNNSMYIFGGFEDFRGSSSQLWEYNLLNQRWELRNLSSTSACHPEPRHSHSAVVHNDSMYIYGGLSNLKPLSDLWRWSWREKRWFKERTRGKSPGQLHGHTAIQAFDSMFVFGGERNGTPSRSLWRLNLSNLTWQKITSRGPRPNPTIFHAAIANPLSILDESNYIIEGDHEMRLKKGISNLSDVAGANYLSHSSTSNSYNNQYSPEKLTQNGLVQGDITHSKSIIESRGFASNHNLGVDRVPRSTRVSRLSFFKRIRNERPRSFVEVNRLPTSKSVDNFSVTTLKPQASVRHSVAIAAVKEAKKIGPQNDIESNTKILDNLDEDIKLMFDKVAGTSIDQTIKAVNVCPINAKSYPKRDESFATGSISSQYQTAPLASTSSMATIMNENQVLPESQRTSYAFTTPPSELNYLQEKTRIKDFTWLAANNFSKNPSKGHNRKDDRPKSEIVQSLIERADARIKHLYLPYFNNQSSLIESSKNEQHGKNLRQSSNNDDQPDRYKDRKISKRHTIHQTMTYYNLYFSEDISSNSPPSDEQQTSTSTRLSEQVTYDDELDITMDTNYQKQNTRLIRDLSTSTIRGGSSQSEANATGTLIGVHGPVSQTSDIKSELSLESDSRTLCEDANENKLTELSMALSNESTSSEENQNLVRLNQVGRISQRNDSIEGSGDNTSMSFSVIAEFEEDDMLQYSSPTDPVIIGARYDRSDSTEANNDTNGNDTIKMEVDISYEPVLANQQAQKSSSSGYESFSGSERHKAKLDTDNQTKYVHDDAKLSYKAQNNSISDTQEDSSVRTESSLGFSTNVETSPEQSAQRNFQKKTKTRPSLYRRARDQLRMTNSSTTTESWALNSEGSYMNPADRYSGPSKSLPSSPPEDRQNLRCQMGTIDQSKAQTDRKVSLISRPKFFGKRRSKIRYWQLCMFVIGGKQVGGSSNVNEPISIWRLYI